MLRQVGTLCLVLALAGPAVAGEIVLTDGSQLAGDLANELLLISTGTDVIEVAPEQVGVLTPDEIRLKDGRAIRGTLVGGHLKVRTPLGELAIKLDRLRVFRADGAAAREAVAPVSPPGSATLVPTPEVATAPTGADTRRGPSQVVEGARKIGQGVEDAAKGVGKTVTEGADRLHDGAKAFGKAVWDTMKSVGHALRNAFTGS